MFLKKISTRIALWYAFAFLLGAAGIYGFTSYFLLESLRKKDEHLLRVKFDEYAALYQREGRAALKSKSSALAIDDSASFVVRLADRQGKTIFFYTPNRSADADALTVSELEKALSEDAGKSSWLNIKSRGFGDDVEAVSGRLSDGNLLQIGKDTEDREEFIESFSSAFLIGVIPVFLFSILIGVLLSNRFLRPIRLLTETMQIIRAGGRSARVPLHRTEDELRNLGSLFNEVQSDNERLIAGMRDTVNNVAHDLRTPITGLLNSAELALGKGNNTAALREALQDCHESADSIRVLVDGIMDIAEAEAGTLPLRKVELSLADTLHKSVDLYSLVAEEKEVAIEVAGAESPLVQADPTRMLQAISNLLDNAIKYSPPGSRVQLYCFTQDGFAGIAVADAGLGVPDSEHGRVWDRLYRGDLSRSTRGLGLGLSLVRAIANAHGGKVGLANNKPTGAVFTIYLPLSPR
jgi:signal transduction histidine kinase